MKTCKCNNCEDCMTRADERALRFLRRHLTRAQKRSLKDNEWFFVKGNETGDKYRVYLDGDDAVFRDSDECHFCLDVMDEDDVQVPEGDRVLARKLLIQADEGTFLKVARPTMYRR